MFHNNDPNFLNTVIRDDETYMQNFDTFTKSATSVLNTLTLAYEKKIRQSQITG